MREEVGRAESRLAATEKARTALATEWDELSRLPTVKRGPVRRGHDEKQEERPREAKVRLAQFAGPAGN